MKLLTTIMLILSLASCASQARYSEEVMYDIASILKDINQAVDGELKFGYTSGLTNDQIIKNATSSNSDKFTKLPELAMKANISEYRLISELQADNSIMMICDGDVALMEDVGCNAEFDKIYWNYPQPDTCKIKLDAMKICGN